MVWLLQFGLLVLSPSTCGMAVPIRSTGGFERKNVCVQFGQLVVLSQYVWYGCYNLVKLWF